MKSRQLLVNFSPFQRVADKRIQLPIMLLIFINNEVIFQG